MTTTIPEIVRAAQSRDTLNAALAYERMGFSVLACKLDKSPALSAWKQLTTRAAAPALIRKWNQAGLLQSVGIICGAVSGGLIVIDCDGLEAVQEFGKAFPALTDTYKVISGSGQGAHFYLIADDIPPTTRTVGQVFGNIELRSNGAYVVAPPSMHPSGSPYRVGQGIEIKRVRNLNALRAWIESLIRDKHHGVMPPPANARKVWNATPYARAALNTQADRVRLAPVGTRNHALNLAAFRMGRMVREGHITREEVITALARAADDLAKSDGLQSVYRTIASGLDAGVQKYDR